MLKLNLLYSPPRLLNEKVSPMLNWKLDEEQALIHCNQWQTNGAADYKFSGNLEVKLLIQVICAAEPEPLQIINFMYTNFFWPALKDTQFERRCQDGNSKRMLLYAACTSTLQERKISRGGMINKLLAPWYNNHQDWLDPKFVWINNMGHAWQVASSVAEAFLPLYVLIIKEYLWQVSAISE